MPRILFICNDSIGTSMAGPGIRYWEMAHALSRKGHEVVILAKYVDLGAEAHGLSFIGKTSFLNLLKYISRTDYVIEPGSPLSTILIILFQKKLIVDQYDPVIFEFLERIPSSFLGIIHKRVMLLLWKIRQRVLLRFGDRFLVANEKQKDFLIGQMALIGHASKLVAISILPFGLLNTPPARRRAVLRGSKIKDSDFLLVWGGGIWDWFDPFTLLLALSKIQSQREDIKVYFPGVTPPSPDSKKMATIEKFLAEAKKLGLLEKSVFVNTEWTSYEERANYLLEADAGISLHRDSLETRFAFRTRMLDYLWAGLPIIASKGDCWAESIERQGLGVTVAPGDIDGTVAAIIKLADDRSLLKSCTKQVKVVAKDYTWDNLVKRLRV